MKPLSYKLYHFPGSRSARVRWALLETHGDDFELETLQLMQGVQFRPDFLQKNPNHAVPVLEISWPDHRKQCMLESTAMLEWLAEVYPEKNLAPTPGSPQERADYLQILHFLGGWMDSLLWQIRLHRDLLPAEQRDQGTVERNMKKIAKEIEPQLLTRLQKQAFICGAHFTVADIIAGHNVIWARMYGLCQDSAFKDYKTRLASREAFKRAFDDIPQRQQ